MSHKLCLECQSAIKGRSDKKFCDDNCRVAFHNKKNTEQFVSIRHIDSLLKRNRKILMDTYLMNSEMDKEIEMRNILKRGFMLDYFTHTEKMPNGRQYQFCYDYGYSLMDNNFIHLIRHSF